MSRLGGRVALVTGASRGVGRGIARELGEAGATVWITGRTSSPGDRPEPGTLEDAASEVESAGGRAIPVRCDHASDGEIAALFRRIGNESGRLDLLVNNAYSGVREIAESAGKRFWETDPETWDRMNAVGLRAHYVASVHAARLMVPRRAGLIVNVSSIGSIAYLSHVAYGVGKAALDRMTSDMAVELRGEGVAVVSLWPGLVRTELTAAVARDLTRDRRRIFEAYAESPRVAGRAVAALAEDPRILRRTGRVIIAAEELRRLGLRDETGRLPWSPRSVRPLIEALLPERVGGIAAWVPPGNVPFWAVRLVLRRFSGRLKERGGLGGGAAGPA